MAGAFHPVFRSLGVKGALEKITVAGKKSPPALPIEIAGGWQRIKR